MPAGRVLRLLALRFLACCLRAGVALARRFMIWIPVSLKMAGKKVPGFCVMTLMDIEYRNRPRRHTAAPDGRRKPQVVHNT
jgi:hypothetical protein